MTAVMETVALLPQRLPTDGILLATARREVDRFREIRQQQEAEGLDVGESIDSFNFGNMGLQGLPAELVDIIREEAERLALDRNKLVDLSGLAPRFGEFTRLKYLVLRNNALETFPTAILNASTIEFLDLKGNMLSSLPEDLDRLGNLKILSVRQNKLEKLPVCIGNMTSLHCLTTRKNPITWPHKAYWKVKHRENAFPDKARDDKARDIEETKRLKQYLREYSSGRVRRISRAVTEADLSEMMVETPRPFTRKGSGRFPIKTSAGNIDQSSNHTHLLPTPETAPIMPKAQPQQLPPTPLSAIRPGISPTTQNERSRSNSESQMTTSVRRKRMGIQMSKSGKGSKELDLETLSKDGSSLRHSRGLSYGSAFTSSIGDSPASQSPSRTEPPRSAPLRRLSSLPERKRKSQYQDPHMDLIEGISFSLDQIYLPIKLLAKLVRELGIKQRGLEQACRAALMCNDTLRHKIQQSQVYEEDNEATVDENVAQRKPVASIRRCCVESIRSSEVLLTAVSYALPLIVANTNPRHVRSLMHLLFASTIELRNSYMKFATTLDAVDHGSVDHSDLAHSFNNSVSSAARPLTSLKVRHSTRHRNNSSSASDINRSLPKPLMSSQRQESISSSASFAGNGYQFSPSQHMPTPILTPSDSFDSTITGLADSESFEHDNSHQQCFEDICTKLSKALRETLNALPTCSYYFGEARRQANDSGAIGKELGMCEAAFAKCRSTLDIAQELTSRIQRMDGQNAYLSESQEFWQLCNTFTREYALMVEPVKVLTRSGYVPIDVKNHLRPVQRWIKEVSLAIDASPWGNLAVPPGQQPLPPRRNVSQQAQAPSTSYFGKNVGTYTDGFNDAMNLNGNGGMSSGYQTPVQATPQTAALGPAAIPSALNVHIGNERQLYAPHAPERSRSVSARRQ